MYEKLNITKQLTKACDVTRVLFIFSVQFILMLACQSKS